MARERWQIVETYYRRSQALSAGATLRALLRPRTVGNFIRRLVSADTRKLENLYIPSVSRAEEIRLCSQLLDCPRSDAEAAMAEIEQDHELIAALRQRYRQVRPDITADLELGRFKVWYATARLLRPAVVVETGVHDGLSSTLILRALSRNGSGRLVSIDLPSVDLPPGVAGPGWLIPEELKARWTLELGDSRQLLPVQARKLAPIDIFIHDSLHDREFQTFEYRTVQPFLSRPGLLLTDDANPELLSELAAEWFAPAYLAFTIGGLRFAK